jgi:hypothetical protein
MPRRLSRRYLEMRLRQVAQALNWTELRITRPSEGRFHVSKDGGATLTGSHRGYTAGELDAWFAGILFADKQARQNPSTTIDTE